MKPDPMATYCAITIRMALVQLRERADLTQDERHTLELVCDQWDEFEQQIGTDSVTL